MIGPVFYALDDDKARVPPLPARTTTDPEQARRWNDLRMGIFLAVNRFAGARRAENLVRIVAVHADLDTGTIDEQAARIAASPIKPSRVVRTRRGFQLWFAVSGDMTREQHATIMRGIVEFFGADPRAVDVCRLLRAPGFHHHKAEPFLVELVSRCAVASTAAELLEAFPAPALPERVVTPRPAPTPTGDDFFAALESLDQGYVLECLSGSWLVGGETIELARTSRGRRNLIVDGRHTSNFIDEAGRIGARSTRARHDGGPLASTWTRFYGHDDRTIRAGLIELVPDLRRFGERRHAA